MEPGDPEQPVPRRTLALTFSLGRIQPQVSSAHREGKAKETPNITLPSDAAKDRLSFL